MRARGAAFSSRTTATKLLTLPVRPRSFTHYYANQKKVTSQSEHKELLKRMSEEASLKVGANRSEIRLLDERIDFMKSSIQQAQTDKKRLMEKEKELQAELKAAQKTYESFKVGEGGH